MAVLSYTTGGAVSMSKVRSESICRKYLAGGIEAVKKLLDEVETEPSRSTIRGAMKMLQEDEVDFSELDMFFRDRYGFGLNNRHSRTPPQVGDEKSYSITHPKQGPPYVKVPVTVFNPQRGGRVSIRFESDEIVLTRT